MDFLIIMDAVDITDDVDESFGVLVNSCMIPEGYLNNLSVLIKDENFKHAQIILDGIT